LRRVLPPSLVYTGPQVAEALGLTRERFYRLRKKLEDEEGMPPGIQVGRELRYSKLAFEAWLNDPRRTKPQPVTDKDPTPPDLRARFDHAYGLKRR